MGKFLLGFQVSQDPPGVSGSIITTLHDSLVSFPFQDIDRVLG